MALSEDVRRRLAASKATVTKTRPTAAPAEPKAPKRVGKAWDDLTDDERGFRERAAADEKRTRLAMDSEFWFTVGFDSPADRARFVAQAGLEVSEEGGAPSRRVPLRSGARNRRPVGRRQRGRLG